MDSKLRARRRRALLEWYVREARRLPWRTPPGTGKARSANVKGGAGTARANAYVYRVWVSEVMLQQTRVETVLPRYERWLRRFPDVAALAKASESDVLAEWSGLGYYSRARRLHEAAGIVARDGMPHGRDAWARMPGIGPYAAGAIASIAQGEGVAAVDGNAVRVLSRWHAWPEARAPTTPTRRHALLKRAWREGERLAAESGDAGTWNQAIMDLGAMVCTRRPRCDRCPVAATCEAARLGVATQVPAPRPRKQARAAQRRRVAIVLDATGSAVLLVRRPPRGLLAGMWVPPGGPRSQGLGDAIATQTGIAPPRLEARAAVRHVFTHCTWDIEVWSGRVGPESGASSAAPSAQWAWVPIHELRHKDGGPPQPARPAWPVPALTLSCLRAAGV